MASINTVRIPTLADPPAPDARTTTANEIEKWTQFVSFFDYTYQTQRSGKRCPTCRTGWPCNNHVCLQCMEGGLCQSFFVDPKKKHYGHPRLQGRSCRKRSAVHTDDLSHFIGLKSIKYIHVCREHNRSAHCLIRRKQDDDQLTLNARSFKRCASCQILIVSKFSSSAEEHLVCSLECLIPFASQNPALQLLNLPRNHITRNSENWHVDLPEEGKFGAPAAQTSNHIPGTFNNWSENLPEDGDFGALAVQASTHIPGTFNNWSENLPEDGDFGGPSAPASNHMPSDFNNWPDNLPKDGDSGAPAAQASNHILGTFNNWTENLPEDGDFGGPPAPSNMDHVDLVIGAARRSFACNLCDLVPPTEAVGAPCGHLFCWACLYRFLQAQPKPCPTCATLLKWTQDDEDAFDFAYTVWAEVDSERLLLLPHDEIEWKRMLRLATWLNSLMLPPQRYRLLVEAAEVLRTLPTFR